MANEISIFLFFLFFSLTIAQQPQAVSLAEYDFSTPRQIELPKELKEISGLASSSNGKIFAHNDEVGDIFQINIINGAVVKTFSLGPNKVLDDFEGIAIVGSVFYMVNSSGLLYEFAEGKDGEKVPYKTYRTPLTEQHNVEGLCYDPKTNALLLACKGYSGLANSGYKAVFSFSLAEKKLITPPRFLIPIKQLRATLGKGTFRPSGIEYNAATGTFFVLDSKIFSIVEISPEGNIISTTVLPSSLHRQPEGITFAPDGSLIISDEGKMRGMLTVYKKRK